ncbi:cortical protein KAR9-domain-containing protein [Staphylotrichum tortipilum]|uniref:Cortical protein KAR9-domain-containing protein n=1 Tax=Staphylotrichum tortipilum TaxID=2831512 RepID=A0AAN6MTR7_9PEZI|nr:cortical protein KAR9-domain-containing protein [Staphylotrichum longicolle]
MTTLTAAPVGRGDTNTLPSFAKPVVVDTQSSNKPAATLPLAPGHQLQLQHHVDHAAASSDAQHHATITNITPNSSSSSSSSTNRRHSTALLADPPNASLALQHLLQQPQQPVASAASPPSASTLAHRVRKPSPGLAARLKALGFGTSRKSSSSPPSSYLEPVGRLPEEQLRRLDQEHLAGSAHTVVERRGRPWKGVVRISSLSSLKSDKSHGKPEHDDPPPPYLTTLAAKPDLLPEIAASEPLEMDTNKYRLPDHTNGNGVKAQIGTREEHIARDTRPPRTPHTPELPPPPLPKDTPPLTRRLTNPTTPTARDSFNPDSLTFNPLGLQRPGSIYTISRASFANQLAQLTSLQLPDADSLSNKVSAIPTAQVATRALIGAAEQIRGWIYKASEVIGGLESDDDVEWAAAGGREGVEEVENAIIRFEELIKVYVSAIEELQSREDIGNVSTDDLRRAVAQMEAILEEWAKMRNTLHSVKAQVEIAMEWEELWNMVLGDIQNEMDELSRLVFEMEERRHKSMLAAGSGDGMDIGDLETIVEDTPRAQLRLQAVGAANNGTAAGNTNRFSVPVFPVSPTSPPPVATGISQDDSSLLALFARMQPLRASLDFLPMRLSVFEARAEGIFPTSCEELEIRRTELDITYKKLEKDAESLRKELGEDRWVLVFRGAARQAQKMYESVDRSVARLREAIDTGLHLTNQPIMAKKLESYEAKKTHYGPAIERVLSIIDKGVKDRLTVNGEILRLHAEMQTKWADLKDAMADLDAAVEEIQTDRREQQLRDSVSSMLSNDMSIVTSSIETPESSPPSSVIMSSMGVSSSANIKAPKQRPASALGHNSGPANRRQSSLPTPTSQVARKPVAPRMSTLSVPSREGSATPTGNRALPRPSSSLAHRPKWNGSTNTGDIDTGHNFKPLSLTTPSPYTKKTPSQIRSVSALTPSSASKLPTLRTPLSRATSASPIPEDSPSQTSPLLSFRERLASSPQQPRAVSRPPRLVSHASGPPLVPNNANRRASLQPPRPAEFTPAVATPRRPASSLASSRRSSMLPQPRTPGGGNGVITGRESPQAVAGARFAMRQGSASAAGSVAGEKPKEVKPRWRG